jgi:hypothetical protein
VSATRCFHVWWLICRDYKPELERLAKDREEKAEAAKKSNLERAMRDLNVEDRSTPRGDNPFGPYPRNERQDRWVQPQALL